MASVGNVEHPSPGMQYEIGSRGSNNSIIDMALGEGSGGAGSFFMIPPANGSDNVTGNFTMPEPFTMPFYVVVWVVVTNVAVFLAGVLGNLLVIIVVLCVREMKTATNMCLMNLSIADLLVLVICQPSALLEFFMLEKWLIGEAMCKLVVFLEHVVTVASILIIVTVSMERFWAVFYPLKTYSSGSKSKTLITLGVVWLAAILSSLPFLVMAHTVLQIHNVDNKKVPVCVTSVMYTWHRVYVVARFILVFVVPLILLAVLYSLIIFKVVTETMECKQMTDSAKSQSQQNRKQLVIMLVGIIILFFVCLLPFRIIALWEIFAPRHEIHQIGLEPYVNLMYFCRLLVYINSAGNPIIYNIVSTKFRRAFQKVLRLYCCCCKKRLSLSRGATNGTFSHGTRMTTMSHYSVVKQDTHDISETADAV